MAGNFTTMQLTVHALEVARGHDGLLRGDPEPVVISALYAAIPGEISLVGRTLSRFDAPRPFPKAISPDQRQTVTAQIGRGDVQFIALVVALEEDSGVDIQRVFGMMERPRELALWATDASDPTPLALQRLIDLQSGPWVYPTRVHLCLDGRDVETTCDDDKWVGCCAWTVKPRSGSDALRYRAHLLSADEKNDWTALVEMVT